MKKRKLNSKNPRYNKVKPGDIRVIDRRVHVCNAPIRNSSGKAVGSTCTVYAVFYR